MARRFTMDGSDAIERFIERTCGIVRGRVCNAISARHLEGIVLGGGYGRGQGGVLRCPDGDRPYNDIEFYVFTRGNRLLNARRYTPVLCGIGEELSVSVGVHVEFKIDSLERLQSMPVSMFTYDLVTAHRVVFGPENIFANCERHLEAACIPISEATRLLWNRCSGLLLAKEKLMDGKIEEEEADFIARNIAKAQLALGDAVLTLYKQYHWDCLERHERLACMRDRVPAFDDVLKHHAAGVAFKLHPARSQEGGVSLRERHATVSRLARELWLFIESRRLNRSFASPADYAACGAAKCSGSPSWVNYLLNLRTFGIRAAIDPAAARYPRERLFNALPLLLWEDSRKVDGSIRGILHARSSEWRTLVAAYKKVWPAYG